jgi:plastocyanin
MRRKLTLAVLSAASLLALAPTGALARTFTVDVGPPGRMPAHLDFDAFFPSALTVHAGDSVRFQIMGFHDVAYLPPGMARSPLAIPDPAATAGAVRDAAGAPLWFDSAPRLELNPLVALPAGGATLDPARYANSGLPSRSQPTTTYLLRFTRPGTYRLYCLVHGAMSVRVRVVPHARSIPSPAQVQATARAQLQVAMGLAQRLERVTPPRLTVLAGHDAGPVAWMRFFPENLRIRAGQTVTFQVDSKHEPHTITFGPEAYTGAIERTLIEPQPTGDGSPALVFNPLGMYPSEPPGSPLLDTGANHGNGFLGSGPLDTDPRTPNPSEVRITFTKPGTYHYECVIHPGMDGTITVTR